MPSDISNINEWPNEIDVSVPAPQHHKLLMENDFVRVIDTLIPKGEITSMHAHKWPASLYVNSRLNFIRYHAKGTLIVDSRKLSHTPLPSSAHWPASLKPYALENSGENSIHIISVEIKT